MARSRLFLSAGKIAAAVLLCTAPDCFARAPEGQAPLAQSAAADSAQIASLVRQLGDKSYRARENATRDLIKIGVPAKAELLGALEDPDAEIRYRVRLVLADVLETDFRNRLEAFVDDADGTGEHDLPCWPRFRAEMGEDAAARRLFADMQRSEPGLLEASDMGIEEAGAALDSRCQQIQESLRIPGRPSERQVSLGTVAALLFVGSTGDVPLTVQSAMYVTNFCHQQPFRRAITGSDAAPALRKLLGGWVKRDFGADSSAAYQTMMLALQFSIREGIEPALVMIDQPGGNPHMRQFALLVIGKFGTPEHIARLETLLDDHSICAQQQIARPADATKNTPAKSEVIETHICDVALAAMLHLSGQKLSDYGFDRVQPNGTFLFNTSTLGFAQPSDREAALAKWHTWRAAQQGSK